MAKKSFTSDHQKQSFTSISHPLPRIADAVENLSLDEDDDICPVCESECTCRNKSITTPTTTVHTTTTPISLFTPSPSSITPAIQNTHTHPLKIKLTLPPHLKSRRLPPETGGNVASQIPPRRRGRPSKAAAAARDAALRTQVSGNAYSGSASASSQRQKGKAPAKPKKPRLAGTFVSNHASSSRMVVPPAPTDDSDFDDGVDTSSFPTFISALSLEHSSSSESDSSITSLDSDGVVESDEDDGPPLRSLRHNKTRTKKEPLGGENQKRPHTNNWEIKSRMRSEGPEDPIMEVDSEGHSSSDGGADDEDEAGDIEEDEDEDEEDAEVVAEADVEGEGLLASAGEPDEIDEDESLTGDGKLGVSFGGVPTGWSEEDDEESSFDADLFFANLEESSDSDDSPHVLHDAADSDTLSADERDALLLMDVDSSTHIRRSNSDLEFGVSLHGLSFGWEGILSRTDPTSLDVDLGVTTEYDIDMTASSDVESTGDDTTTILEDPGIILDETDGETTEDELVDANGLPNPRAMMLFQWPTTVPVTNQSINPMSTMSSSTSSSHSGTSFAPPLDASPSVRIALASFSAAQRGSSPPTPADILSGKISAASDLEEHLHGYSPDFNLRTPTKRGGVCMGKFVTPAERAGKFAVVDGSGMETATPFPRIRSLRREIERERSKDSPSESDPNVTGQDVPPSDSIMPSSSDEVAPRTHSESSPDAFDLDDVLEPSFLDLEPVTPERNTTMSAPATVSLWDASSSSSVLPLPQNDLSRWDRIPVATFRRTRESAFTEYPGSDTSVGGMGTPMSHSLLKGRDKVPSKSSEKRSKGKRAQKLVISPVLLPLRDGDGLLTDAHFAPTNEPPPNQNHQNKSRKERKENNAKRKAMGKYTSRRSQQQQQGHQHHHHHGHFPNMKSRGSGSMQRTNFFAGSSSSVPHLSL